MTHDTRATSRPAPAARAERRRPQRQLRARRPSLAGGRRGTFAPPQPGEQAGILSVEEGRFVSGSWENIRWLNGDQTRQGRHLRLEPGRFTIQRIRLYRYR